MPTTVLRATQFHEFLGQLLDRARGAPVLPVPRMWSQTVAAREVAAALVAAALDRPAGRLPDLAGPRVERMEDLVRQVARARNRRALVVPVRLPGRAGRAMAEGALLPTDDGPRARSPSTGGSPARTRSRAELDSLITYNQMVVGLLAGDRFSEADADRVFHALSDSTRRDILARAIQREQSVSALARHYEISLTAVQKHVTVLERAALISKQRSGREQLVAANADTLRRANTLLRAFEQLWIDRANRIAEILEEEGEAR